MTTIKLLDARRGLHCRCIELFKDERIAEQIYRFLCEGIDECEEADPERKKGKWISHPGGKFVGFPYMHYECDQCRDFEPEERNFCPNCGADMKGEPE